MVQRINVFAAGAFVFAMMLGGIAFGAGRAVVNIPFGFYAEDQSLPAGTYEIWQESEHTLMMTNKKNGNSYRVNFVTRLSKREDIKSAVVFDKADGKSYLSEVYLLGDDGFDLHGAPGKHTHVSVKQ